MTGTEKPRARIATDQQHTAIIGANGSGKTYAANWNLANRDFDRKPWIVYDFKYDELINSIDGAQHIEVTDDIPTKPGIYIVHPTPQEDNEAVERQLRQIWSNENTGLYIDEGYMVDRTSTALSAIMTQGRSKHVPVIILTQRPVWVNPFVLSEAQFIQVFRLSKETDRKAVANNLDEFKIDVRLPKYHSYYYDVERNTMMVLPPSPDGDAILDTFNTRLRKMDMVL